MRAYGFRNPYMVLMANYMIHFHKTTRYRAHWLSVHCWWYIFESLEKRKGSCKMCGGCCGICPYLKDKLCTTRTKLPEWCNTEFPIDKRGLGYRPNCGFYWENDEKNN